MKAVRLLTLRPERARVRVATRLEEKAIGDFLRLRDWGRGSRACMYFIPLPLGGPGTEFAKISGLGTHMART